MKEKQQTKHIDISPFKITDSIRQDTRREEPTFYRPCSCGCDTRDGNHDGWAGYVRAMDGAGNGVAVWVRTEEWIPVAKCIAKDHLEL